jgi:hypothetical protein
VINEGVAIVLKLLKDDFIPLDFHGINRVIFVPTPQDLLLPAVDGGPINGVLVAALPNPVEHCAQIEVGCGEKEKRRLEFDLEMVVMLRGEDLLLDRSPFM